jgi:NADH-quinone oxidoreductase subunit C
MLSFDELVSFVRSHCHHGDVVPDISTTPLAVKIPVTDLANVCKNLHEHPSTYFDMLSCVTAVDNGPEANTMEMIYNLYSIPFNHHLTLKVILHRENPAVESLASIWKTADWHEREAFDLLGIQFTGHPDLRRILLPGDWIGHPLRKDYKVQEYYHGIKYDY